jgi:hypothetical protein
MSHPQTIKAGFKAPPHDAAKGRGPPIIKRENLFCWISPPAAIISYNLYRTVNDRKRVEER